MNETAKRLESLGVSLPEAWRLPPGVDGEFAMVRQHAGMAWIAGHGPVDGADILMQGRVGDDLTIEDGQRSARLTALSVCASLQRALGDLDRVTWLRATVYVHAAPGLEGPALTRVGDGFSGLVNDVFGLRGEHARATLGVSSTAFNVPTIVEALVALDP